MTNKFRNIKILIVDDSDIIQNSLKSFFVEYNVDVVTCSDGLEGIKKAAEEHPDLIFLDLVMPNLDGLKMLQVINVINDLKNIPVVVISANTARSNVLAATEAGAAKIISKPLQKERIFEIVNELLGVKLEKDPEKVARYSESEQIKLKQDLVQIFLNTFSDKKTKLQKAIRTKDLDLLKDTVHDIRGAGGTIGVQKISDISGEIEDKDIETATDWVFAEFKINELTHEVNKLEELIKQ